MKKILLLCLTAFLTMNMQAQNEKYVNFMKKNIAALDSAKSPEDLQVSANNFERIANTEKDAWLPNYYAAYAYIMKAYYVKEMKDIDPLCDKADVLLANAESLSQNNSEIATLKAMCLTARMRADGSRGMTMGPKATLILQQALQQQPASNPRALMQMAQMKFYTPPAFGGGKDAGIELLKKSIAAYDSFKPASELDPTWGKPYAVELLAQWTAQ
ncbi:hypothetical protein [Phnomibacter sp. MR]|uniref:hypothetical protein n=1 Tax=Phnomibacter sp. MR TaxID=3042318 RepID=UPI003A8016B8